MSFYRALTGRAFIAFLLALPLGASAESLDKADFEALNYKTDGGIIGIELTFTNNEILEKSRVEPGWFGNTYYWNQGHIKPYPLDSDLFKMRDEWFNKFEAICKKEGGSEHCSSVERKNYRIFYPDGWFYQIEIDHGVIEITARPLTARGYEKIEERIQRDIFDFAANGKANGLSMNLAPHKRSGDGHMHLDLETNFKQDGVLSPLLFRNFFVDFQNHGAMVLGAIGNSLTNAPLMIEGAEATAAFQTVLREWDKSLNKFPNPVERIKAFADLVTNRVYKKPFLPELAAVSKQHALNLDGLRTKTLVEVAIKPFFTSSGSLKTLEIRALPPQKSAREIVMLANLFKSRLDYLRKFDKPIAYEKKNLFDYNALIKKYPRPNHHKIMNLGTSLIQFYNYVNDAGISWDDYKLMTPKPGFKPLEDFQQHYLQNLEKYYRLYFAEKTQWSKFLKQWSKNIQEPLESLTYIPIAKEFIREEVEDEWRVSITKDIVVGISDSFDAEIFKVNPKMPQSITRILMELETIVYGKRMGLSAKNMTGYFSPVIFDEIIGSVKPEILDYIADYIDLNTPRVIKYHDIKIIEDYKKDPE